MPRNSDITATIDEWVQGERDRKILKRSMIDCRTHEQIAEEMDISPRTVDNVTRRWRGVVTSQLP
jgi:FixJ family two-component response regulator